MASFDLPYTLLESGYLRILTQDKIAVNAARHFADLIKAYVASQSGGSGSTGTVLVSQTDSVLGYLGEKLITDNNTIISSIINPEGNEQQKLVFRPSAPFSLVGNPTNATAPVQDITLGTGLGWSGTSIINTAPAVPITWPAANDVVVSTGTGPTGSSALTFISSVLGVTGSIKASTLIGGSDALVYAIGATGTLSRVTLGTGLTLSGGTLSATGGTGTVTAVTATAPLFSSGGTTPNLTIQGSIVSGSTSTSAQNLGALTTGVLQQSVTGGIATISSFSPGTNRIPFGAGGLFTDSSNLTYVSGALTLGAADGSTNAISLTLNNPQRIVKTGGNLSVGTTSNNDVIILANNNPVLTVKAGGDIQFNQYGAGLLKTDNTGLISLSTTTVTPGSYTNSNVTVNALGQITAISNGSSGAAFYQTWENQGTALIQRAASNASTGLTATDNGGAGRTDLTVDLSTGVGGGQSVIGGLSAGENLTITSTASFTKGNILLGLSGSVGVIDEDDSKVAIGQSTADALFHVVTANDTALGATTSWDNRHVVFGRSGSTGGALGVSTTIGSTSVNLSALSPSSAWWNMRINAHALAIYGDSTNLGLSQDSSGNVSIATLAAGGIVTADVTTGRLRVSSNLTPTFKWSQGYSSSAGMLENSKTIVVPGDSGMMLTAANAYNTLGGSVISVITSNWGTIGAGLGTFYKTHQDVSACQLDIVLSYGVAISLDLTNADATVEFSLWFTTDITNAGATWSNPITITVTMPSSAGAGTVTTGTYTGSHSFGSPFTGPVYVFLAARRTDVASGTTVNPLCFTGTLSMV